MAQRNPRTSLNSLNYMTKRSAARRVVRGDPNVNGDQILALKKLKMRRDPEAEVPRSDREINALPNV